MTQTNTLLELRNKIKDKKPHFIREDYQRRKRLGRKLKWKKPKGIHSKIRHHFKGRRKMPSPGYKSPVKVKGLHPSGLKPVNIFSVDAVKKINNDSEGVVISKNVGAKKRLEILKKAVELNINVLNLNADAHIKKIENFITSKKKNEIRDQKKAEIKEQKKTELKESEQKIADNIGAGDGRDVEKAEKDKILTKKM